MAIVRFGDVAIRVNTKEDRYNTNLVYYVGGDHLETGELKVLGRGIIKDVDLGPMFYCGFKQGDILFVTRNPHLRKCAMADFSGICSEKTFVIGTKDENVLMQKYLAIVMQTDDFWDFMEENKSGSVNYFINWSTLADYEFDLPPMEEQKKVAELLWAANDLKEKYKKAITATDEMLKAKFREMTCGVDYVCLGEIASEWIKGQSFKKNAIVKDGLHKCIHYGELFTKYGPVIENVISCTNESIIRCSKRGDILFPASDVTPMGLSRCSALMLDNVLLGGDIICMRPLSNNDAQFISYAINQETSQLLKCVSGSIIKHLSANRLKNVSIPIPPLSLQREFVAIAEKAESAKTALKKSIADIDQVMKGLINQR